MTESNPEVAHRISAGGIGTNYHDQGEGPAVLMIHGSGPGVSAWANWRLAIPALSRQYRVIAPDMVGFGFSDRPAGIAYTIDAWVDQTVGLLDALCVAKAHVVGKFFRRRDRAGARDPTPGSDRTACADGVGWRAVPDHAGARCGLGL